MVPNTGVQSRTWWWYYGLDAAAVTENYTTNNARLVSARPYRDGGSGSIVYAVVMVSNLGIDSKPWAWLPGRSIATISSAITSSRLRVVAFTPNPGGAFDAILVGSEGEAWGWWYGLDAAGVSSTIISHNTRLIDIAPYTEGGVRRFAIVELDTSNPEQDPINAESTRVWDNAEANGWRGGFHGTYASSATGPVVAYNSQFRFEPASSIKALYLLYTLRLGVSLASTITYYWTDSTFPPPFNVCTASVPEIPANAHTVTISEALTGMIKSSNNVYTRAFAIHWGLGPVQAFATSLGMSSTFLNQPYIGCGFSGGVRNEATLVDFATLYRAVDSGSALTGSAREDFLNFLVGGPGLGGVAFRTVVAEEAASTGRSSRATEFMSLLDVRWKAGSYRFPLAPPGTWKVDFSIAGLAYLPFRDAAGSTTNTTYFFGDFVNDLVVTCPDPMDTESCPAFNAALNLLWGNAAEALRTSIHSALLTWPL